MCLSCEGFYALALITFKWEGGALLCYLLIRFNWHHKVRITSETKADPDVFHYPDKHCLLYCKTASEQWLLTQRYGQVTPHLKTMSSWILRCFHIPDSSRSKYDLVDHTPHLHFQISSSLMLIILTHTHHSLEASVYLSRDS